MTIQEAEEIIKKTDSPMLKRDLQKFVKRQRKITAKGGNSSYGK